MKAFRMGIVREERGVALISALAMLALLTALGTAYVSYMSIEQAESNYDVRVHRAEELAKAGIAAASSAIAASLDNGEVPQSEYRFSFSLYDQNGEKHPQEVVVRVSDESGRINVNHAPREVLEAMGMERAKVRELKSSLPRLNEVAGNTRWLVTPDELMARGYMPREHYAALDKSLLTVWNVADPHAPERFLNLNTLPPQALAWVLNLSPEQAENAAAQRPFVSFEDVVTKVGKPATEFNVKPDASDPDGFPDAVGLSSRCYRLVSEARVRPTNPAAHAPLCNIETVVMFLDDGTSTVRYWKQRSGEAEPVQTAEVLQSGTGGEQTPPAATLDDALAPQPVGTDNETGGPDSGSPTEDS